MIYDAVLFSAEADILTLRMMTLRGIVDRHIVVACTRTYQGQPADVAGIALAYREAARRAGCTNSALYWHEPSMTLERPGWRRLERPADERGPAGSPWFGHIERQHRDSIAAYVLLDGATAFDTILVSDVDEIPHPAAVDATTFALTHASGSTFTFAMRFHSTALNLLHPQQPWYGTTVSLFRDICPQAQRDARTTVGTADQQIVTVPNAGWHLSWFGTDEQRTRKLDSFSHAELRGRFDPAAGRRDRHHANGEPLRQISLEESWAMDWPAPLLSGEFQIPACWFTEDAWAT